MAGPTAHSRAAEFRQALLGRILVADGAMATNLFAKGVLPSRCVEELNLSLPAAVRDVHREFMRAGAEILETNTFGANRLRLAAAGFGARVRAINQAGVRIAREASGGQAFVAGAAGPLGAALAPLGPTPAEQARAVIREQIEALVAAGVDLLILETFQDLDELQVAAEEARAAAGPEMVVVAQVTVGDDARLPDGTSVGEATRRLEGMPVDVLGLNCGSGPRALLDALEAMAGETDKPLSAMPSGGMPARGRGGFPCSPRYLAQSARRAVAAGASLIGGCCGTTADHIYEMRGAIAELPHAANRRGTAARNPGGAPSPESAPVPMAQRSALGAKLAAGEFAVLVEILPPRGLGSSPEVDQATEWGGLVVTPEIGGSRVRAETACHLFQQVTGGEAVLAGPFALRPEAVRSQLLDACACGVRNILATGPHAAAGAAVADRLNRSGALGGSALLVGVEGDEVPAAGCDYLVTPPLFSVAALEAVAGRVSGVPVIATIRPLASLRDAEFVVNELGAAVPEELLERMRRAGTGDAARAEGLAIAGELAAAIRPLAAGLRLLSCGGDARAAIEIGRALAPRDD